jgi:hypothetical protein
VCEDEMLVDLASNQVKVSMREERKKESIEQPFSRMKQNHQRDLRVQRKRIYSLCSLDKKISLGLD